MIKQLKQSGFIEVSQTGSHLKLFNSETQRIAIVPIHQGKMIPIGTLKSIEKQSGITFSSIYIQKKPSDCFLCKSYRIYKL